MMEPEKMPDNRQERETGFSALPKGTQRLIFVLVLSLVALPGVAFYAANWETIREKDYPGRVKSSVTAFLDQRKQAVTDPTEHIWFVYDIAEMSHEKPILTVTPVGVDLISVPLYSQAESKYRTGCELVSASMVLNYYQEDISPRQIYEAMPKVYSPTDPGYGVSPKDYFIGNPSSFGGYGCYAPVLCDTMNELMGGEYQAVDVSGTELTDLEANFLSRGVPVILWGTVKMDEPKSGSCWTLEDGTEFHWVAGEHCLVLVGSDEHCYYFNDPNHEGEIVGYERSTVEDRYEALGRQAIILSR